MSHVVHITICVLILVDIAARATPKSAIRIHIPGKAQIIVGFPAGHRTSQEGYEDPRCAEEFQCSNGKYIRKTYLCDGDEDCLDGTDEYNCPPRCENACVNGVCVARNTCACDDGWRGDQCQVPKCEIECVNGVCGAPNTCACDDGWLGDQCQVLVSPGLDWLSVGSDQFVRFNQTMTWDDARSLCRSHGLDLYKYKDIQELSEYLDLTFISDRYETHHYWLGGRGNGTHQVWLSGDVVPNPYPGADPWYSDWYPKVGTNECLTFLTSRGWPGPEHGRVQATNSCDDDSDFFVLCA